MSELKAKLSDAMKNAMRSKDKDTLTFARNLHAAIRKKEIDGRVDLTDEDVQQIVGTMIKQRQDSVEQFKKGGREDLVAQEEAEIAFLLHYLPPQMSEEEVNAIVSEVIGEVGASGAKDMGKVMQALMPRVRGKADGKLVNQIVKSKLGA